MNGLYNVGSYVRLSKENVYSDSETIENQREMLSRFIAVMPGWIEQKCYIDNGFSGGTFDRPAFAEMMEDVRNGRVNLVLVKDLSRFGRNYLEAGNYLENELPALGCRFVSLLEGIDTESGENDILPFINAMNDHYLKNLSDRIKLVLTAKAKEGQKLSGAVPYGYLRSPEDHLKLIVDEYAAGVVRRIFQLRAEGAGYASIAGVLNREKVMPPRLYYFHRQNRETPQVCMEMWYTQTVKSLLRNELYIGNTVQFTRGTRSYRDATIVDKPPEDWIRVNGTHPAIVSAELWAAVRAADDRAQARAANQREHLPSLFSGMLVCDACGATLVANRETHVRKRSGRTVTYQSYHCRIFSLSGGSVCTRHTIYEVTLKKIVLEHIRQQAAEIALDEGAMLNRLRDRLIGDRETDKAEISKERRALRQRLHQLDVTMAKLYEDRVTGVLSESSFSAMARGMEAERQEKEQRLSALEQSERDAAAKLGDIQSWIRLIKEKSSLEDVNRDLLESLIEKIEIGERVVENGVKRQDIRIHYKFVGII